MTSIRELTERLVRVRSVLPHEEALAELVAAEIRKLGIEPDWYPVAPGRPNVACQATLGPRPGFVTFTGHLDTVAVADGWETNPFEPVEKNGRLYGLGALDMKSGLAAAFLAFKRIYESPDLHGRVGRIGFAATVDEEALGAGARALLGTPYGKSDLMLLTEPFNGTGPHDPVPTVMSGKVLYRIVVRGQTSHALAHPERGINAIDAAAVIVTALEKLPLGVHPVLGPANYSVLKIDGGYREYACVVPEHCEIIVTRLLIPGETKVTAVRQLEELIGELGLRASVSVEVADPYYDAYEIDPDGRAAAAFRAAYAGRLGREPFMGGLLGITDANIYQPEGGIETIIFGPKGEGLHEKNEFVELDSLEPVVDILVDTAFRYWNP